MNIKDLTEQQKLALLDLAMIAMYADGHLTTVEDERVHRLLGSMGLPSDYDRDKYYDASVSRVSRHSQTAEAARIHATTLAQAFSTREQRRYVQKILEELVTSDGHISLQESSLLSVVREALQM
jgi:uncharacterized tellurite resistance protein B-like protein